LTVVKPLLFLKFYSQTHYNIYTVKLYSYSVFFIYCELCAWVRSGRTQKGPGVGAGPQGRSDPRHRTDPLGPFGP